MNFSRFLLFKLLLIVIMSDSKSRSSKPARATRNRSNVNAGLMEELAAAHSSVSVPSGLGVVAEPVVPAAPVVPAEPVVPAFPAVPPAAPVQSDTKIDVLMNMLASANASRASELNSILVRMESLQDSNTRSSRSSVMAKYLQAVVDISVVLNSDKKALNGFVSAIDKKDLASAKSGVLRAARRLHCTTEELETVEDILDSLPPVSAERPLKRLKKEISCFLCGGPHYQSNCPNRRVAPQGLPPGAAAVLCPHCGKPGHAESSCWTKYPHLRPRSSSGSSSSSSSAASQ